MRFVSTRGGVEPASLAHVSATVRLLPGALSDLDSARVDSFFDERGLSGAGGFRHDAAGGGSLDSAALCQPHQLGAQFGRAVFTLREPLQRAHLQ